MISLRRSTIALGVSFTSILLLAACQSNPYSSANPRYQIDLLLPQAAQLASNAEWSQNTVANEFGSLIIKNNLLDPTQELTYGWYHLNNLDEFIKMTEENANLEQSETGCKTQVRPLQHTNNTLLYEEVSNTCQHKLGTSYTYGKAFLSDDGVYAVSYTTMTHDSPIIQAIDSSQLVYSIAHNSNMARYSHG